MSFLTPTSCDSLKFCSCSLQGLLVWSITRALLLALKTQKVGSVIRNFTCNNDENYRGRHCYLFLIAGLFEDVEPERISSDFLWLWFQGRLDRMEKIFHSILFLMLKT